MSDNIDGNIPKTEIELQLGDIIQITNPKNDVLNNQVFLIDYIDSTKVILINTDTLNKIKLKINNDGILGDGYISMIEILSRSDLLGYARQNNLVPGKWVNIFFSGDYPVILTGEITNIEEDMIEITTIDKDVIYINFDYKGIPEYLPIDNIEIREKPTQIPDKQMDEEEIGELPELEEEYNVVPADKIQIGVPVKNVKDQLREIIIKADQIKFGDEDLGKIIQYVDVASKVQRYSVETQVSDLLDDLLSTIPNTQRTPRVLNNIHTMIERFKQLRLQFSTFDKYGTITSAITKESTYKPLNKWLNDFNNNLYWILPVVKNIKKVYNAETDEENINENNLDFIVLDIDNELANISELLNKYKSNDLQSDSNKYNVLYSEFAKIMTPFNYVNSEDNEILIEKEINSNINVIVDNLEDLYSSVFKNNMIRSRRFVISRYNMGETKLDTIDNTSSKMINTRVKLTQNDLMSIKSIMTLPEPVIRFSKINLPNTNLLEKANLNMIFLNYWQLLKKKTPVNNVFINSLENEINFNETTFVNSIKNYVMNISDETLTNMSRNEVYQKYVNAIVPKTKTLFNLIKKYITGKLSIVDVVGYLEPFLIYTDDLTYNQYVEIVKFIDAKISEHNKNAIEFAKIFKLLSNIKHPDKIDTKAYSIMHLIEQSIQTSVFNDGYQIDHSQKRFTNQELLSKILAKDNAKLFTSAIALESTKLMFPNNIENLLQSELNENKSKEKDFEKCKNITIAKMYTSLEKLQEDNDVVIYFDKKYDNTNYGVMEEDSKRGGYSDLVISQSSDQLKDYIMRDQIRKHNLSEFDATYIAETLINGVKKVVDGQYAILYKGYAEKVSDESDYYIRKNNKWVLQSEMSEKNGPIDESDILCNLQEQCININNTKSTSDNCESIKKNELSLQNSLLNNIINEFDSKYKLSKEQFEKEIREKYEYFLSIMPIVSKIEANNMLKYNNQKYNLGANIENNSITQIKSPFAPLLDIILGQKDISKKQTDIIKFANKFTRTNIVGVFSHGKMENEHWLYCIKTNEPLLPTFKKKLAVAFITSQQTYLDELEQIKSTIGQLSDDGDWWTDKFTGWPICPGDFDTEEGYNDGFKVSTRAVLEESAGNKIISSTSEKTIKYITFETITINNIINALSTAMGINIETQKEFIINSVLETIKNTVESENDYKEKVKIAAQKGKSLPSYRDFFNTSLLYYTLGMYLIATQTIIPNIKTRKTHPGCVRSFTGFPIDGQGDDSALIYLSCIVYDIRSSSEPWNVLKKTSVEKIQQKIRAVIDTTLLQLNDVQRKFVEKAEYLLTTPSNTIIEEHDISNWTSFLPPLTPFKIKHLVNISDEFKRSLVNDLKHGNIAQKEKMLVIESKIIQFSLAIQEKIQQIVKNHKVILHTANNEPYLENACCDSKDNETTISYFNSKDGDILEYNKIVTKLNHIIDDVKSYTDAPLLSSNFNSKSVYTPLSHAFNEKSIYLAFIFYCKFKSLIQIPDDLLPLCTNKPEHLNSSDTIEILIKKLKDDGRNYTNAQFLRLIQLISRKNIININLEDDIISDVAKLTELIDVIYDENNENELVEQSLRDLIKNAISTFDTPVETYTIPVKNLNNFLILHNEEMTKEIINFVQNNSGANITRSAINKFTDTINNITIWSSSELSYKYNTISNDYAYATNIFYKTFIINFANIFPTIILNKVNYDNAHIQKYYGFSNNHIGKLTKYISSYFEKLKPLYGDNILFKLLNQIAQYSKNVVKLSNSTPCFSSIKNGSHILKGVIDERTSKLLFEYYLFRILIAYIELTDDENMLVYNNNAQLNSENNHLAFAGDKRLLKQKVAELLVAYVYILKNEKNTVDITYDIIQDRVFKLKEREKDLVTDRLKSMTDEERDADTILKITKQGMYSIGLQKGLTVYDDEFYDREQTLRDEMVVAETKIRRKNNLANDENVNILVDEYLEQQLTDNIIDDDAYDMSNLNEDFYDGYDYTDIGDDNYDDL